MAIETSRLWRFVTDKGGTPCGSCRQVMAEFGTDILVIIADEHENIVMEKSVSDLAARGFFEC